MTKLPISVFIIAKNEADRIPLAILSVRDWVDEVHVIDSGSDDDTIAVSRSLGAKTHFRAWTGYGEQKVYGETLSRNDWLLNIDADEEVSSKLAGEIRALFLHGEPGCQAYRVPVLPVYAFQERAHPWTVYQRPIRLYRRTHAGFSTSPVHDSVLPRDALVGRLRGMLLHRSFRSIAHHMEKMNAYSGAQAEELYRKGRKPSVVALLLVFPLAFLKYYFLRRNFVNGVDGVIVSGLNAFWRFLRLAKARERFRRARGVRTRRCP